MRKIVVIPSFEPPRSFIAYATQLSNSVDALIVVNDGSGKEYDDVFDAIGALPGATVLSYGQNKGKGYALKYAFSHCLENFSLDDILVTTDCDGQHCVQDVIAVCNASAQHPYACVLGVRDFSHPNVPARSRTGNTQTLRFLRWMFSMDLTDSQTGLRAFTVKTAKAFLRIGGNRFEFETGMLIYAKRNAIPILEVPIQTIYPENSEDHISHYKTFRDSFRIAGMMLRYFFACPKKIGFWGSYARFAKWLFRTFSRRYYTGITEPEKPVVYVCRHLNMHGPYTTLKTLSFDAHPMIIHMYFDKQKTIEHMTQYTFAKRYGKKPMKFNPAAYVMGLITPPLTKSFQAVPVYRNGAQSLTTIKRGLKYLLQGDSLIIYPDVDYMGSYETVSEIYDGFLFMGELYYKKTGKLLPFVPLIIDEQAREIKAKAPVTLRDYRKEGKEAAQKLKQSININWNDSSTNEEKRDTQCQKDM